MNTASLDVLRLDLRHAIRRMLKKPGFALTAILSLALGIGANTAIFRVVNAVRLVSLRVSNPEELVEIKIAGGTRGFGVSTSPVANATYPLWREIQTHQQALAGVFAWGANDVRMGDGVDAGMVRGLWLSQGAFQILGIHAVHGTLFGSDGCDAGAVVISHAFWMSRFNGQDSAIGSRVVVEDRPLSVAGVTPERFFGLEIGKSFDVALPLCERQAADQRLSRGDLWWLTVMGRLRPNTTADSAAAQIGAMSGDAFQQAAPSGYDGTAMALWRSFRLTVVPAPGGISQVGEQYGAALWFLLTIAAVVLLIACLNLSNLLLAQANARESEMALRMALGVGRGRLAVQLLTENMLLAMCGAVVGSMAGAALSRSLPALMSTTHNALYLNLTADWRVMAFTALLALVTCAALSLAPVLKMMRIGVASAIRSGSRSGTAQPVRSGFQGILIGSQLALSLFLLVGSLSLVRSFRNLSIVETGFRQDGLIFCFADFSRLRLTADRAARFQRELLEAVRRAPGIESASTSTHVPLSGTSWTLGVQVPQPGAARFSWISDGYFRTLSTPFIAGRDFTERDTAAAPKVLIVNQAFARLFNASPGTLVRSTAEPGFPQADYEVVGIVRDSKYDSIREPVPPAAYVPEAQSPEAKSWLSISFRSTLPFGEATGAVRRALAQNDPQIRVHFEGSRAMSDDSMVRERMLAWVSGLFSAVALVLTCVGLYGVIAYVASLRQSEIAVRMAMGATSPMIVKMMVLETLRIAMAGVALGVLLAVTGGRLMRSILFGVGPVDSMTILAAVACLITISVLATVAPALRASSLDPSGALRSA